MLLEEAKSSAWEVVKESMEMKSVQLAPPPLWVLYSLSNHSHGAFACGFGLLLALYKIILLYS